MLIFPKLKKCVGAYICDVDGDTAGGNESDDDHDQHDDDHDHDDGDHDHDCHMWRQIGELALTIPAVLMRGQKLEHNAYFNLFRQNIKLW